VYLCTPLARQPRISARSLPNQTSASFGETVNKKRGMVEKLFLFFYSLVIDKVSMLENFVFLPFLLIFLFTISDRFLSLYLYTASGRQKPSSGRKVAREARRMESASLYFLTTLRCYLFEKTPKRCLQSLSFCVKI
jgi:hypothetical protein